MSRHTVAGGADLLEGILFTGLIAYFLQTGQSIAVIIMASPLVIGEAAIASCDESTHAATDANGRNKDCTSRRRDVIRTRGSASSSVGMLAMFATLLLLHSCCGRVNVELELFCLRYYRYYYGTPSTSHCLLVPQH